MRTSLARIGDPMLKVKDLPGVSTQHKALSMVDQTHGMVTYMYTQNTAGKGGRESSAGCVSVIVFKIIELIQQLKKGGE